MDIIQKGLAIVCAAAAVAAFIAGFWYPWQWFTAAIAGTMAAVEFAEWQSEAEERKQRKQSETMHRLRESL